MSDWYKVEITVDKDVMEPLTYELLTLSRAGAQIEDCDDYSKVTIYPSDTFSQEELNASINKIFGGISASGFDISTSDIAISKITDENWAENHKQFFHQMRVGRLLIKPSWEGAGKPTEEIIIELDPGLAFGTGSHPTTEGCLYVLQGIIKGGETVFDIGTGSGILAIAAVKLGADRVIAIDNDPIAIGVAQENAVNNKTDSKIEFRVADIAEFGKIQTDIIVANITAPVIIKILPQIMDSVTGFKHFIASGITSEQKDEVIIALNSNGLVVNKLFEKNQWVTLVCSCG
ncbi:MAG: 50S ribosomal protein L11 methyltransferase [Rubrobacteridae bacterium]|nr:50S ribosomal protein L11 methyltransferase [Rubrobacteridae bacterium]